MNRKLIDAIIHGANLATADSFPGQKMALKDNAMQVFKLMMDEGKVERCSCGAPLPPNSQECDECAFAEMSYMRELA